MNDRFKFRVWDKKNSEYVPGGEMCDVHCLLHRDGTLDCGIAYDDGYAGGIDWVENEDAIIEQCTGLTDKNGNLIYEGDVLRFTIQIDVCVTFRNGGFVYSLTKDEKLVYRLTEVIAKSTQIIGNIHEDQFREVTKLVEKKKQ